MPKMVISIEAYGEKHSVAISDESTIDKALAVFLNLLAATGYAVDGWAERTFVDGDPRQWEFTNFYKS